MKTPLVRVFVWIILCIYENVCRQARATKKYCQKKMNMINRFWNSSFMILANDLCCVYIHLELFSPVLLEIFTYYNLSFFTVSICVLYCRICKYSVVLIVRCSVSSWIDRVDPAVGGYRLTPFPDFAMLSK